MARYRQASGGHIWRQYRHPRRRQSPAPHQVNGATDLIEERPTVERSYEEQPGPQIESCGPRERDPMMGSPDADIEVQQAPDKRPFKRDCETRKVQQPDAGLHLAKGAAGMGRAPECGREVWVEQCWTEWGPRQTRQACLYWHFSL